MSISAKEQRTFDICFEGVENNETLDKIQQLGESLTQGYVISKPLTDIELLKFVKEY